jgi:hypothetical protein
MAASSIPSHGLPPNSDLPPGEKENPAAAKAKEVAHKAERIIQNHMSQDVITEHSPVKISGTLPQEAITPPDTSSLPSTELPQKAASDVREDLDKRLEEAEANAEKNVRLTESSTEKPKKVLSEVNKINDWERLAFTQLPSREPPREPTIATPKATTPAHPGKSILKKLGQKSEASSEKRVSFSDVKERIITASGVIKDKSVTLNETLARRGSETTVRQLPKVFVEECIDKHVEKWERSEDEPIIDYKDIKSSVELELFTTIQKHPFRDKKAQDRYYKEVGHEIRAQIKERKEALEQKLEDKLFKLCEPLIDEWETKNPEQEITRHDLKAIKKIATQELHQYLLDHPKKFRF